MTLRRIALAAGLGCALGAGRLQAQSAVQSGYPNVNRSVAISPGDTVQLLNRLVFAGGPATRSPGRRLDLQYATRLPASDSVARHAQADRAAEFFGPDAVEMGARRLSIGICDTRACAETRDPPAMWFLYERTSVGGWRRVPQ